jgi:hypothetical protein
MRSSRPPPGAQFFLSGGVDNNLGTGPSDPLVRCGHLLERRNPEAWVHVDGLREGLRPPRSVSLTDAAGAVTGDEALDLAVHLDMPGNGFEEMPPAMIRRDADDGQAIADPLAETLRHLLPLRIRVLSATGAGGIIEQGKAYPSTLFDKFEEPRAKRKSGRDYTY